jgi:predicted alpha/beta superfamily hydrolase
MIICILATIGGFDLDPRCVRSPALLLLCVVSAGGLSIATAPGARGQNSPAEPVAFRDAGPVAVSRERQFDLTSRINGQTYRLMISAPLNAGRDKACPVLYVLDGNWYFRAASDTATWGSGPMPPAVVVGIGYPTEDDAQVHLLRAFDMSLSASSPDKPPGHYGGGDAFLRVIEEEVKPFVAARYKVDPARQAIYGKSFAGLLVLRAMFRNPASFSTYIAASPYIGWNSRQVLSDEGAFSVRARAGELHLKLLLTPAGNEPKTDYVSALAARLAKLNPQNVAVVRAVFPDESHNSVSLATIGRAVRFALEPSSPTPP